MMSQKDFNDIWSHDKLSYEKKYIYISIISYFNSKNILTEVIQVF